MHGIDFRIYPEREGWAWEIIGAGKAVQSRGQAASRAEAAAFVIRAAVRAMTPLAKAA